MKKEVYELADIFKALGDPTRLRIIKILASNMVTDVKVTDVAQMLGISQPAVSQHLKILKNIGILTSRREGYRIYYNIDTETFKKQKKLVDDMFELVFKQCATDADHNPCK